MTPPPLSFETSNSVGESTSSDTPSPSLFPFRTNPQLSAPIRVNCQASTKIRDQQILKAALLICPDVFPTVTNPEEDITVDPLTGGLSNMLFVVSSCSKHEEDQERKQVLVRVHFDDDESDKKDPSSAAHSALFVDREQELIALCHLSQKGLAPKFYGCFENGRIEEFYRNVQPLSCAEMKLEPYLRSIAKSMGRLHCEDVPMKRQIDGGADCWNKISDWFNVAKKMLQKKKDVCDGILADSNFVDDMLTEWTWVKKELESLPLSREYPTAPKPSMEPVGIKSTAAEFAREVVFAHMDLQSLNILKNEDSSNTPTDQNTEEAVRIIDFEYAGYNPRAVDIANTFMEFCDMNNLKADYTEYPAIHEQNAFLTDYVMTVDPSLVEYLKNEQNWDTFLQSLREEVGKHTLVSHLGWAVWAVVQNMLSPIDFDFAAYAVQRMEGYRYFKERYWKGCPDGQNTQL